MEKKKDSDSKFPMIVAYTFFCSIVIGTITGFTGPEWLCRICCILIIVIIVGVFGAVIFDKLMGGD